MEMTAAPIHTMTKTISKSRVLSSALVLELKALRVKVKQSSRIHGKD